MSNVIKAKGRRVWHCPPHFTKVPLSNIRYSPMSAVGNLDAELSTKIRDWLHTNIQNRFYLGSVTELSESTRTILHRDIVAFEEPSDATFFALMQNTLHN